MKPEELYPYIEKNQPNICQISVLQNGQDADLADIRQFFEVYQVK